MILGIEAGETGGAALYDDGRIIYAASEERFSRKKNDLCYPHRTIKNIVKKYNLTPEKLEKVVFVTEGGVVGNFLANPASFSIADWVKEENEYYWPLYYGGATPNYLEIFKDKIEASPDQDLRQMWENNTDNLSEKELFKRWRINRVIEDTGVDESKIEFLNHDYCHAAYGFYGSPYRDFNDVLCVVVEGMGDYSNAGVYVMENERVVQLKAYDNFNIGRLYRFMTLLLGMKPLEHEYKVMGLAPYATEYNYREPYEVFKNAYDFRDGEVWINPIVKDNYFYFRKKLEGMRFDGIAAGLQLITEDMIRKLVSYWMEKTGKSRLVISGGVSLNVKVNLELGKLPSVKDMFVPGSGGDESHGMSSIFYYLDKNGRGTEIKTLDNLYLGDEIGEDDISSTLKAAKENGFEVIENTEADFLAKKLAEGLVLGRVAGRMEFGARALGNRSILADPRNHGIVDRINSKIKNRDFWMPFTPSILDEDADNYLDNPKHFSFPYMTVGCETTELGRKSIPAALHPADHTARPEIVSEDYNRSYYHLIKAFKDITGVGALLNTSLNLHGYPIVRTAAEGFYVLTHSDLDGLIIENNLILRKR